MSATDHAAALEWAAAARDRRAEVLDALSDGRTSLSEALELGTVDPLVGLVKVLVVLEALPGARKVDTRRTLTALGLDGRTPLDALDGPRRDLLVRTFPLGRAHVDEAGA